MKSAARSAPSATFSLRTESDAEVDGRDRAIGERRRRRRRRSRACRGVTERFAELGLGDRVVRRPPQLAHGRPAEVADLQRAVLDGRARDAPLRSSLPSMKRAACAGPPSATNSASTR